MDAENPPPYSPDGRPFKAWLGEEPGHEDKAPVFVRRDGRRIIVREKDPCDPAPARIPFYEGDEVVKMQALPHISLNTTAEQGDTLGFIFALRIVPTRHEPGTVYARTLRYGEEDDGRRVHIEPGETVTVEQATVSLDHIDAEQEPTESGYVPLTPVLWNWLSIGERDDVQFRYLLAAARRLDQANELLMAVERHRTAANEAASFGPLVRQHAFAMIGAVETTMVTLGRAVDMAEKAAISIGTTAEVPETIATLRDSMREVRNAYEHIEDRALGTNRGKPDPTALTIFDHDTLLREDAIVYGKHRLSLDQDLPQLLAATRTYLKEAARERDEVEPIPK